MGEGCGKRPLPPPPGRFPRQRDSWCYGKGRWGRRWGCIRAWERKGDPIKLKQGQDGGGRGQGTGPRFMPSGGQGAGSLAAQHPTRNKLESHRLNGAPALRSPDLSWGWCAPLPPRHSHWERTRGALPRAATTAVPLASSPPSGRSTPRTRAPARQPQPPLPPAAAARCELKERGRRTAPLSQPRVRARQPLSLRPGLSFPPRKWVQGSPRSLRRRGAPTGSSPPAGPRMRAAHSPLPS